MLDYRLEHVLTFTATLNPPEVIGPLPEGIRANFYATGGDVRGPRVNGKVLPVGGDWLTVRTDGVAILDVRASFQTDDGALIYVAYSGVADLGEAGYQKFMTQDLPPFVELRTAPRFHTAHPAYAWMNRIQCVGIGRADMATLAATYDVYAVR
jgi:hypothetical protein